MVGGHGDSPYVRLCSLYTLTYYFASRVVRKFGYHQLIHVEDTIPPKIYGLN